MIYFFLTFFSFIAIAGTTISRVKATSSERLRYSIVAPAPDDDADTDAGAYTSVDIGTP